MGDVAIHSAVFGRPQGHGVNRPGSAKVSGAGEPDGRRRLRLEDACRQMESLFLGYLLKEMRATVPRSGLINGGMAEEIFTSMLDQALAGEMAGRGGIGLATILMNQLSGESRGSKVAALKGDNTNEVTK